MTGREKIEAAFEPDGTSEFPAVICYEGIFARDHWDSLTSRPWWTIYSSDISAHVALNREIIDAIGQDWFALPQCHSRQARESTRIVQFDDGMFLIDDSMQRMMRIERPQISGWWPADAPPAAPPSPKSTREIDRAVPASDIADRAAFRAIGCCDLADALLAEFGREKFAVTSVASPLWQCHGLWGFEGMMTAVAERPKLVEHACDRFLAQTLSCLPLAAELGVRGVWIEECMTDMVSPDAFARLSLPRLQRLTAEIRSLGMRSIYYYCGDPSDRWDLLMSAGADALSLEESKKGFRIDIADVVDRVQGRCMVLGNLDAINLLPHASDAQLRREIARQLDAGRRNGNRFIMSIGSPVTPETTVERVRMYCEMVRRMQNARMT